VQILDRDGFIVVSAAPRLVGRSQVDQPFFIEGQSRIFTQRFYPSDLFDQITLTVSAPLFDDKNKLVGVLALHFNMRKVDGIIRTDPQVNEPSQSYLLTPAREIITDDPLLLARAPDFNSFAVTSALNGEDGTAAYLNHDGVAVIGRYAWIENHNAALIVEINEAAALAPARQLAVNILLAGLLVSILIVMVVILLARSITRATWMQRFP
jgi:adenylate cyclase